MNLFSAARSNALASYVNFVATAVVTIVVSPLLVTYLGSASFGIWKAIQKMLDVGTAADGRATQALKWVVAARQSSATDQENRKAVGSAIVIWMLFLPATLLIAGAIAWFAPSFIKGVSPDQVDFVRTVAALLALNLILVPLLGIPDAVLVGVNRGYASMTIQTAVFVATNLCMVLTAMAGAGLLSLAGIMLSGTAANALLVYLRARRLVRWFGLAKPSRAEVRAFFGFSGWVLVWSIVSKVLLFSEVLLLTWLVGPTAVTDFTFTSYAPQFALAICFMTGAAAMPAIGRLINSSTPEKAVEVIRRTREVVLLFATVMCGAVLLFNKSFVGLWAGPQHYMGDLANGVLVLSAFQTILVRNEAQIQDLSLDIKGKVLFGAAFAALSLATGYAFHVLVSPEPWAIFAGTLLGRAGLSLVFPVLVRRMTPGRRCEWRRPLSAAVLLGCCYVVGSHAGGLLSVQSVLASSAGFASLVAISICLLLDRADRVQLRALVAERFGRPA